MAQERLRILMSAFCCDANDVSEDLDGYHWVREMSRHCDVTVFTLGRPGRACGTEGLPNVRTVKFPQTSLGLRYPQLEKTLLPSYYPFSVYSLMQAMKAMSATGFDLAHQVAPVAMRFPSSMSFLGIPFVLGPVGGGLQVPSAFAGEVEDEPFYHKLRCLDRFRTKCDPLMLWTFARARRILVLGGYCLDMLPAWARGKAQVMLGTGVTEMPEAPVREHRRNEIHVIYVGRVIASKGLRYILRALGRLSGRVKWRLTVAGDGPDMPTVRNIAAETGGPVDFVGWVRHGEIGRYYAKADVFCLPSIKEAGGNVAVEALSYGLPCVVCQGGGPATSVTRECGVLLSATNAGDLVAQLARALEHLAAFPDLRMKMSRAARRRIETEYLWEVKGRRMLSLYEDVVAEARADAVYGRRAPAGRNRVLADARPHGALR